MEFKRCSGILMPISSLPGGYGIGSMGKPAHDFVDFLAKAGQTIWQILPVGPTGYADSPYQSCSAFAGNPYFIDLDLLATDGLLTKKDYAAINWGGDAAHVDYGTLYEKRFAVLRKAYANFLKKRPVPGYETPYPDDWYRFRFLSSDWLPDYCLYMAIKEANGMVDWQQWPRALRVREPEALAEFKAEHAGEIEFWAFLQYEFDRQWRALHAYAKEKGVLVSNIPTYGTAAVGQFAIAMLLEICHHIGHHDASVHAGNWANCVDWCYWDYPLIELEGQTIGIIGFGRIGQAEGRIAKALGMLSLIHI